MSASNTAVCEQPAALDVCCFWWSRHQSFRYAILFHKKLCCYFNL